ncbi:MAG: 6-bladed beta-propeller [Candidatus Aminicenantes bacterium]|nr:6-bladed beta-propeller [Candidatus Aminicenantes bacterium]NIQ66048.1 6-bladed beta-propeller [Candidatus Aminicenantes bacterium]NIT22041.1 6-bladed beta-propeller [Candidatus Aminicenantes bacterium]
MKKIIVIAILMVMIIPLHVKAEVKLIENPGTPKSKDAGRIIIPEEEMLITDEEGDFYFKSPGRIKVAPDESIFVTDENQFLRFDKNGKFLNNQFKKGQGPGEYTYILNYQFIGDKIVIFTSQPYKIVETDIKGNLLKETRLREKMGFKRILGIVKDKFWLVSSSFQNILKRNTGSFTLNLELAWGTLDGKVEKTGIIFPEKWYMKKTVMKGGGVAVGMKSVVSSAFVMDASIYLYVSNTQEYMIHQVDLEQIKVIRKFNRKYTSIAFRDERTEEEKKQRTIGSDPKYFSDIQKVIICGGQLWVLTSTIDREKGILVDVFLKDGNYIDNFYFKLPGVTRIKDLEYKPFTCYQDFLFTVEEDEEGNKFIVKYKI